MASAVAASMSAAAATTETVASAETMTAVVTPSPTTAPASTPTAVIKPGKEKRRIDKNVRPVISGAPPTTMPIVSASIVMTAPPVTPKAAAATAPTAMTTAAPAARRFRRGRKCDAADDNARHYKCVNNLHVFPQTSFFLIQRLNRVTLNRLCVTTERRQL